MKKHYRVGTVLRPEYRVRMRQNAKPYEGLRNTISASKLRPIQNFRGISHGLGLILLRPSGACPASQTPKPFAALAFGGEWGSVANLVE